jgi:predicted Fe-Mo cluster-binding NifX family protein
MRLGIADLNGRVSPVLDMSRSLLVVDIEDGREVMRRGVELAVVGAGGRVAEILALDLDALICGSVSRPLRQALEATGMRLVPLTCGPVEEVLEAWMSGRWAPSDFLMPGCTASDRGLARSTCNRVGRGREGGVR